MRFLFSVLILALAAGTAMACQRGANVGLLGTIAPVTESRGKPKKSVTRPPEVRRSHRAPDPVPEQPPAEVPDQHGSVPRPRPPPEKRRTLDEDATALMQGVDTINAGNRRPTFVSPGYGDGGRPGRAAVEGLRETLNGAYGEPGGSGARPVQPPAGGPPSGGRYPPGNTAPPNAPPTSPGSYPTRGQGLKVNRGSRTGQQSGAPIY